MNSLVKVSPQSAYKAWNKIQGLLAVYKPADLSPHNVKETIEMAILREINTLKQRPQKSLVKIVSDESAIADGNPDALMAINVPSLADNPLVSGKRFTGVKVVPVAEGMDRKSSGIMVVAIGSGTKRIDSYRMAKLPKTYTVKGRLGIATDTHDPEGKIWEKTTFRHVTRDKLDRVIGSIQHAAQKDIIRQSGVDIQSQEAYELAVKGLLHPVGKTSDLILNAKCIGFEPPEFQLEIECLSTSAQHLRYIIHDIGLELKSSAVATQVRCVRNGPFTLEHALLRKHWKLMHIIEAIKNCRKLVKDSNLMSPELQRQVLDVQEGIDESVRIMEGSDVKEF